MNSHFKKLLVLFSLNLLVVAGGVLQTANASDETEYKNMEQMMGSIRLEKKQVESMLDKMVVSGRISPEEGREAKRALASMKENDLENLKTQAIAEVKQKKLLDH
ncbi:MAG: hypothetical protein WC635_15400 [Bacteriovorax sp.]|jgi:polyhydroxyalkanoate synthesis regulator phasin